MVLKARDESILLLNFGQDRAFQELFRFLYLQNRISQFRSHMHKHFSVYVYRVYKHKAPKKLKG